MRPLLIILAAGFLTTGFARADKSQLGPDIEKTFKAQSDGAEQKYILRLPAQFDTRAPHDLMIALHGHGSDRRQYANDPRGECRGARDVAAKHSMIFAAPDYRENSWMGPVAESDVVQLIGELKRNYNVRKVILAGGSMGGTSVLIFTALHPDLIGGVSSQNGIASLMEYDNNFAGISEAIKNSYGGRPNETLAQYRKRNPAEFRKRSPLFTPEKFTMPVAITVGEKDTTVPPQTTIELARAIQKTNPDVLLIDRKDVGHSTSYEDTVAALEFVVERADSSSDAQYLSGPLSERISSTSQDWGELGFDTAAHAPGQAGLKLRIKDKQYPRGLGLHANGEIVFDLDGQFETFQTEIGVQWQGGQNVAAVVFKVFVDDQEIFKSKTMGESDPPIPLTIPVENGQELRLVAVAAGDGISCDCANWADARLTPNFAPAGQIFSKRLDVAPFAKTFWWDPNVMTGTKSTRVEEMPAADIFPGKELEAAADGTYPVPIANGKGCIGLQWLENRPLRRLSLQFDGAPAAAGFQSVELQTWTGESPWQGQWQRVETAPETNEDKLVWSLGYSKLSKGTPKIRWVFSGVKDFSVKSISAFTSTAWTTVPVRLESVDPGKAKPAEVDVYNGEILDPPQGSPYHFTWDGVKPLSLKIRSSRPRASKVDRTVLRFRFPDTAFGVAVEDLQANDAVYVPHAGLFATREPAPVTLPSYLEKIASRQSVLEQVRSRPDQNFSHAWDVVHRQVEDLEPTMVSLACDNRKFIVRRDGALGFNEYNAVDDPSGGDSGWGWLDASQWRLIPTFGSGQNPQLTRSLQGGWLPMPVTTVREKGIAYEQTTYVAPLDQPAAGDPQWMSARAVCAAEFRVKNNNSAVAEARLSLKLTPGRDPKLTAEYKETPEGLLVFRQDRIVAMIDTRKLAPLTLQHGPDGIVLIGSLPAGAEVFCPVYLPAWKAAPNDYASLLPANSWAPQVETYWKTLFDPAMQIEIPDSRLNNIIRASQVWCAVAARNQAHGAQVVPWIASSFYGPLESEANSIIRGMGMTGHTGFAEDSLDYFLGKCNAAGFITTGYTLVGTGEVLWTLGENYERTHDKAWLQKNADQIVRICQWVMRQRQKTEQLDIRGEEPPEYGLMPPGVTADWGRFAFRFFNDAQYCAGLEQAGRALTGIGHPAARGILEDAARYREDIVRAFHWTQARTPVNPLANGTWVPADPSFLNCFGRIEDFYPAEDGGRTWCYSIEAGAHHLVADGVIDPNSQDAGWMADYLEDVQFLRDGWGDYPARKTSEDVFDLGGFAKLQPYYCRIAEIYALRDEVKPFIRSYFNTIPSLVNAENLSFCEHFHNYGAWNKTHETGWFLAQTRLMFVMERSGELWLAPFVTSDWFHNGMKISVRNAPTAFGRVGYEITSKTADAEIDATVHLPPHCRARKVVLRLRHPDGKLIQSVKVQGGQDAAFDAQKETVTFIPSGETIAVQAHY